MSGREKFWDSVCDYRPYLRLLLVFTTTLLVLTLLAMGIGDQQTDAYVISLVTIGLLGITIVPAAYCVWRCGQVTNEFEKPK
ncbi:hypothetical protein B2G88_00995 [Natronolimnobius baerhuensis]|uniref:Uncharacterized protein n=2 Tax=Natronolimnobius baerhuensis TaxID=253108 RepID=A0A202EB40_9EURY|nr:hypothetical protein B2G88_00995 [Natronolimnobius baerhuensis]